MAFPALQTARMVVRPPEEADAEAVATYFLNNREFHAPWSPVMTEEFFTLPYWKGRIAEVPRQIRREERFSFFMFAGDELRQDLASGSERLICGHAQLSGIMRGPAQFCFLGYALAECGEGRGLMEEALRAIIDYAFDKLKLHRVQANYMPHNRRSGKLLRKLGFVPEGYARDYLKIAGKWEDHILTSLTCPDCE